MAVLTIKKLIEYKNPRFSESHFVKCGIILFHKDAKGIYKALLVKGNNFSKKWGFPKGNRKRNESVIDCAIREMKEETNITIKERELVHYTNIGNIKYFIVKKYTPLFKADPKEITDIKWVSFDDIEWMKRDDMNLSLARFSLKHEFMYNI